MNKTYLSAAAAGVFAVGLILTVARRPAQQLREGSPAPVLALVDVSGQEAALTQYRGKVVLVDFWATWCTTCIHELPDLKRLYQTYRPQGFEILAPSMDAEGRKVLLPFIAEHGIPWRVLIGDLESSQTFDVYGLPTKVLIDPSGKVVRKYSGAIDPSRLEKDIQSLLPQKS